MKFINQIKIKLKRHSLTYTGSQDSCLMGFILRGLIGSNMHSTRLQYMRYNFLKNSKNQKKKKNKFNVYGHKLDSTSIDTS